MKATPKLIQLALGAIGIGAEMEMCTKIHEVVKLLNEKGDLADLSDLAKIAAIQVESEKPQSEPLPSESIDMKSIDMSSLVEGSILLLSDNTKLTIFSIMHCNDGNYFVKEDGGGQMYFNPQGKSLHSNLYIKEVLGIEALVVDISIVEEGDVLEFTHGYRMTVTEVSYDEALDRYCVYSKIDGNSTILSRNGKHKYNPDGDRVVKIIKPN